MGKKAKQSSLGRSLVKDRFSKKKLKNSMLHTSELQDGQDYNRINFNSITEQTDVDNFLATAELAGADFKAEKLNVKFVRPSSLLGVLSKEEETQIKIIQESKRNLLRIPRRPPWDRSMSPEELAEAERESFLDWRRGLAELQEIEGLVLTPYEKNIEFWRQLWRVIERSDVVVQIVDARNPLLFRCEDLTRYVKEVDLNKENLLLVNKADFLTDSQRDKWSKYFCREKINAVFFSAVADNSLQGIKEETISKDAKSTSRNPSFPDTEKEYNGVSSPTDTESNADLSSTVQKKLDGASSSNFSKELLPETSTGTPEKEDISLLSQSNKEHPESHLPLESEEPEENISDVDDSDEWETASEENDTSFEECYTDLKALSLSTETSVTSNSLFNHCPYINSSKILNREELIEVFRSFHNGPKLHASYVTVGLVGYPNVGKSSTINNLLKEKKVSVSATPGKTKHFQTLFLTNDILLCDCPGLVFPAFVTTKEEMILSGILPIDQMRDHVPPMNLLLSLIPRHILEAKYGVKIPLPLEGEDPNRNPTSEEFLSVYGYNRGFMTQRGIADHARSARYILKDYITGRLLYCYCPPGESQEDYHIFTVAKVRKTLLSTPQQTSSLPKKESVDVEFFKQDYGGAHFKGYTKWKAHQAQLTGSAGDKTQKPWRLISKRNTKEKLRRKYAHLDN